MVEKKNVKEAARKVAKESLESKAESRVEHSVHKNLESAFNDMVNAQNEAQRNYEQELLKAQEIYQKSVQEISQEEGGSIQLIDVERDFINKQFELRKEHGEVNKKVKAEYENVLKSEFSQANLDHADLQSIAEVGRVIWSFANAVEGRQF